MGQWKNGQLVQINGQLFRIRKKTKFGLFNDHKCLDCLALPHPVDAKVCTQCLHKCAQHCYPVPFKPCPKQSKGQKNVQTEKNTIKMKFKRYQNKENDEQQKDLSIVWIAIMLFLMFFGICMECNAQKQQAVLDTVACKAQCIQKFVTNTTKSGNVSYKAIYVDKELGVQEIIPVSKSVYSYIQECKEYGFEPILGIKLRNGEVSSIIRIKTRYRRIRR